MTINVTTQITDYEGKPVKETPAEDSPVVTLRSVFFTALNNFTRDEMPTGEIKTQCYQITQKVFANKEVDLTVDQRALILERVRKIYTSPLICGRVEELLNEKK
jgi:hypothetical protein